ncbi:MAG: prolipoprotein diacylglyceryl transferase [Lachnospiraceae bacterium]|nr:prolipoprotein diacylglyceryl transferase [Lachnospiraceae bacterium]
MILFGFLAVGTVLMLIAMMYLKKDYHITGWKIVLASVMLTLSGLSGTKILFWIENGRWDGVSFFGAIFFVPILMSFVSMMLKIPVGNMLDLCAPAECVMLALMKVSCFYFGCCRGRVIFETEAAVIRFPSQIVEFVVILFIFYFLVKQIRQQQYKNQIYARYMIIYGVTRFVLNLLRDTEPFVWILPAGNLWSLVSMAAGCIWLNRAKRDIRY